MSAAARTRIKICGITDLDGVRAAADAGADWIGLVRATRSPRYVDRARAERLVAAASAAGLTCVGVYADVDPATLTAGELELFAHVQVHGGRAGVELAAWGRPVIRGLPFEPAAVRAADALEEVSMLLVDGPSAGSGAGFDHDALVALMPALRSPVILAGGLTAGSVAAAIARVRPYGVDVSSGVESSPGRKDAAKIAAFCAAARAAAEEVRDVR